MNRKSFSAALTCACALALSGIAAATPQTARVSATQKGSLLIFSKVEIKWDIDGNLIQDTILDISNDYPADVAVQAYYVNGDIELDEVLDDAGGIVQAYEPGWNTADCRFELTGNQPHFWSAANGSDKCQSFTVIDPDGPGRPDPETLGATRILRGYVIMWATHFFYQAGGVATVGIWIPIRWNHLKGDAVLVNYADGSAWEYNAWAFRSHRTCPPEPHIPNPPNGCPTGIPIDSPEGVYIELPFGGTLDFAPANLILDFYASGSQALSGGDQTVMVDTDLTLHAVSADLRQDGYGPVLTKVEAEIWNEFESKFSGTRRCICCWDQTMLSDWVRSVAIPNHFTRNRLGTDKGKARLDGVESTECDYVELCGTTATTKRCNNSQLLPPPLVADGERRDFCDSEEFRRSQSQPAAILGLATKFLAFTPSGDHATSGLNLIGAGYEPADIQFDAMFGPQEVRESGRTSTARDVKDISMGRDGKGRTTVEIPAE